MSEIQTNNSEFNKEQMHSPSHGKTNQAENDNPAPTTGSTDAPPEMQLASVSSGTVALLIAVVTTLTKCNEMNQALNCEMVNSSTQCQQNALSEGYSTAKSEMVKGFVEGLGAFASGMMVGLAAVGSYAMSSGEREGATSLENQGKNLEAYKPGAKPPAPANDVLGEKNAVDQLAPADKQFIDKLEAGNFDEVNPTDADGNPIKLEDKIKQQVPHMSSDQWDSYKENYDRQVSDNIKQINTAYTSMESRSQKYNQLSQIGTNMTNAATQGIAGVSQKNITEHQTLAQNDQTLLKSLGDNMQMLTSASQSLIQEISSLINNMNASAAA